MGENMPISIILPDQIDAHQLLVSVADGRTTATYDAHQEIFRQGDLAESVYFVQQGSVELSVADGGVQFTLGIATEGQFFGASCLDGAAIRITSAVAVSRSRITSVTKDAMISIIRERPKFSKMFSDHLWYNNVEANKDLLSRLAKMASGQ
jgi:CRP-like cAMP-binding protein